MARTRTTSIIVNPCLLVLFLSIIFIILIILFFFLRVKGGFVGGYFPLTLEIIIETSLRIFEKPVIFAKIRGSLDIINRKNLI